MLILFVALSMIFVLAACGGSIFAPDADLLDKIESMLRPASDTDSSQPAATPAPSTPAPPPSTPAPSTPAPPPPTPEPTGFKFPFAFSTVDLYGNTVTEEDLGEKELFVAYLWAVW